MRGTALTNLQTFDSFLSHKLYFYLSISEEQRHKPFVQNHVAVG